MIDRIHDGQRDVRDPAEAWAQDQGEEHHQAGNDDIDGRPEEERMVDGEPADLAGLEVGPEVASIQAEEVDVSEDDQHRRPRASRS